MIVTSTVWSVSVPVPSSPVLILMPILISLPGMRVPGSGAVGVALAIRTGVSSARAGTLPTHRHAVVTRAHATHLATRRRVVVCVVMGCLSVLRT